MESHITWTHSQLKAEARYYDLCKKVEEHIIPSDNQLTMLAEISRDGMDECLLEIKGITKAGGYTWIRIGEDDDGWNVTYLYSEAQVKKLQHAGTSYYAECPRCGKTKWLSGELNTMSAFCDGCGKSFKLIPIEAE